jgi:hypothetical protein
MKRIRNLSKPHTWRQPWLDPYSHFGPLRGAVLPRLQVAGVILSGSRVHLCRSRKVRSFSQHITLTHILRDMDSTSNGTTFAQEPHPSDDVQSSSLFLDKWISWAGAAAEALAAYVPEPIRCGLRVVGATLHSAKPSGPLYEYKTAEKVYRINDDGRVLKRSLRENEYQILSNGDPFVPVLVVERLKNEAACMRYLRAHTDIPIPKLLDIYEKNGSYYLWMEFIDGVEMCELTNEEQSRVLPQGKRKPGIFIVD